MITVRDVERFLYTWAPAGLAASWDNVGLLVGDPVREVKKILTTLDITESVVEEAVQTGADLIVSHHPVMNCAWHPVQTLRSDDRQGRILTGLVENRISAICMHTNLDAAEGGVNLGAGPPDDVLAVFAEVAAERHCKLPQGGFLAAEQLGVVRGDPLTGPPFGRGGVDGHLRLEGAGDDPVQREGEQHRHNADKDDRQNGIGAHLFEFTGMALQRFLLCCSSCTHCFAPP